MKRGIGVSPGVVIGPAYVLFAESLNVVERTLKPDEVDREIIRLEEALIETRRQIKAIQQDIESRTTHRDASVLDAHLMVLDDRMFIDEVVEKIRNDRLNVEAAVMAVGESYANLLASVEDDYLRERVADVRDVARRLVRSLDASLRADLVDLKQRHIVVARDLAPSETASLRRDMVIGFVTDLGSPTSHTAVMARALTIPAVVGLSDITEQVHTGDELLVDGNKGVIIVNPSDEELQEYGRLAREREAITRGLTSLQHEPAETRDGHRIVLSANIEAQDELDAVEGFGAEGVGLFRSEYLYLTQGHAVDEDTQVDAYGAVARRLAPAPVIVRTMDIGGDKILPKSHFLREANPFLGCRSIRLSLRYPEPFKAQLRAILRANTEGNVKIMYPMIGNVNEVIRANELLEEAKADVKANDPDANVDIDVGIMVEIPSAALTADVLAEHVQFFSIGTNDLIQYTLAVDRVNEGVAYLYEPTHPAVLRLIDRTSRAAHRHGIWVGVCGEMAADPLMVPLLLGLGMDEFSVAPSAVPIVKDAVRGSTLPACVDLAERALACRTGVEVLSHCRRYMRKAAPELLELI